MVQILCMTAVKVFLLSQKTSSAPLQGSEIDREDKLVWSYNVFYQHLTWSDLIRKRIITPQSKTFWSHQSQGAINGSDAEKAKTSTVPHPTGVKELLL